MAEAFDLKSINIFKSEEQYLTAQKNLSDSDISLIPILDLIYPVGTLYWSKNETDPAILFGGTWERIKDKFILAAGDSYLQGNTGGKANVALTVDQMPAHTHTRGSMNIKGTFSGHENNASDVFSVSETTEWHGNRNNNGHKRKITFDASKNWTGSTSSVGKGYAHDNMPPYIAYYCWERIK